MERMNMKDVITQMICGIALDPGKVEVFEKELTGSVNYLVRVSSDDMGLVLGRFNTTLTALRSIVEMASRREGKVMRLEVLPPICGNHTRMPRKKWDGSVFNGYMRTVLSAVFNEPVDVKVNTLSEVVVVYEIMPFEDERAMEDPCQCKEAFEKVLGAIGKSYSRTVHVDFLPRSRESAGQG